ncbi:MAG: hypothetical protein ACI85I_002318, partial [Arenicella sp.]
MARLAKFQKLSKSDNQQITASSHQLIILFHNCLADFAFFQGFI